MDMNGFQGKVNGGHPGQKFDLLLLTS